MKWADDGKFQCRSGHDSLPILRFGRFTEGRLGNLAAHTWPPLPRPRDSALMPSSNLRSRPMAKQNQTTHTPHTRLNHHLPLCQLLPSLQAASHQRGQSAVGLTLLPQACRMLCENVRPRQTSHSMARLSSAHTLCSAQRVKWVPSRVDHLVWRPTVAHRGPLLA
jgi:hypothetical protein